MIKGVATFGGIAALGVAAALLMPIEFAASAPHFHGSGLIIINTAD